MKPIKAKDFTLREMRISDKKSIFKYANNKKIYRWTLNIPYPYTEKIAQDWIKRNQIKYKQKNIDDLVLAIDVNGEMIGAIGIHKIEKNHKAEIGYWLGEPFWGKGIMSNALKVVIKYAFKEYKLKRLYAGVMLPNIGSAKVLEKNGFVLEGIQKKNILKDGKYIDEKIYALVK